MAALRLAEMASVEGNYLQDGSAKAERKNYREREDIGKSGAQDGQQGRRRDQRVEVTAIGGSAIVR